MYPRARIASQGVSECLADLDGEDTKRRFMDSNPRIVAGMHGSRTAGFSSTQPASQLLPPARHGRLQPHREGSEEVRLIYVVQRDTGLPLFSATRRAT